jgi:uncharacterized protein YqgQ
MKYNRTKLENAIKGMINSEGWTDLIWDVAEFDKTFETKADLSLKITMLQEEVKEFYMEAWEFGNTPNLLKEYGDILYVAEGMLSIIEDESFEIEDEQKQVEFEFCINGMIDIAKSYKHLWTNEQINEATRIIHKSNMSKLTENGEVLRREDGKVLKSDQYVAPNMEGIFNGT